jgi:hypothetical protein
VALVVSSISDKYTRNAAMVARYEWTANGSGAATATSSESIVGRVLRVVTFPGTVAPTASYDVYLYDGDSGSVMGTSVENRSATAVEQVVPTSPPYLAGPLTITIAAAGAGGQGTVVVYIAV